VTDTELINQIESDLFNGRADYLHAYVSASTFIAEMDGAWVSCATLRAALEALLSETRKKKAT
jgi:hypothetical protein